MKKRIISYIMALVTVLTVIVVPLSLSIDISALTPTYTVSAPYKGSKYYKNLKGLELTGDQRTDIVRVALTQLGYHEGNSNSDFHGGNSSGSKNFVEYNRLHGKIDNNEGNGMSYGYYWCASFVTWCANQAGISTSHIKRSVSCREMVNFFQSKGTYKTRVSGYVPKTGDIIMFKDASSAVSSTHTGIVIYSDGSKVYTIEGNVSSTGSVALREYALTNTYIVGYGSPALKENSAEKIDFSMKSGYLHGDYVVKSATSIRKSASSSASALASLSLGDVVKVTGISGAYGKVTKDGVTGWVNLSDLHFMTVQKYTLTYNANGADSEVNISQTKKYNSPFNITSVIPTKQGYVFLGWSENKSATEAQYEAGDSITASKNTTLYAVWERNGYVIKFYNYDGTLISSAKYNLGDTPKAPANPTRASDGVYNYTFKGWDSPLGKVSGDKSYTAVYKSTLIPTLPEGYQPNQGTQTPDGSSGGNEGTNNDNGIGGDASQENGNTSTDGTGGDSTVGDSTVGGADDGNVTLEVDVGCASLIGVGTVIIIFAAVGAGLLVFKKKED